MGLKDSIREKSKALVRREPLKLPACGETVTVRGLMAGEQIRIGAAAPEKQVGMFAAMGVEDGNGKPVWNVNDWNDMQDIEALHGEDLTAILTAVKRLSGMGDGDSGKSETEKSSTSSSPSDSGSLPTSSASD